MARIGVIVPVYNVEAYLDRCVRSILSQSHRDLRLVLVDDGSPDGSGLLCDGYAAEEERVHVIHQKNGGLSAARNAGLDYLTAAGDCRWVTFIDSDDWVHPEMLERMLEAAEAVGTKICVSGYAETGGEDIWLNPIPREFSAWKPEEFYLQHIVNATISCAKLFSLDCFAKLRFPVGKLHEDEFTTYKALFAQDALAIIDGPLYAYFVNREGITKGTWRPKRLDAWEAYEEQLLFFQEKGFLELYRFRLRDYLQNALVQLEQAEGSGAEKKTAAFIRRRIRNLIRRCWHAGLIHFRFDFTMLVRFYPLTTRAYRFYLEKIKKVM